MNGKRPWTASDTAEMSVLTGRGWSDARIGRKLGFARETVTRRRNALGLLACRRDALPYLMARDHDFCQAVLTVALPTVRKNNALLARLLTSKVTTQ